MLFVVCSVWARNFASYFEESACNTFVWKQAQNKYLYQKEVQSGFRYHMIRNYLFYIGHLLLLR
jgi:hypothetical protein